jgi:hypothetical protein
MTGYIRFSVHFSFAKTHVRTPLNCYRTPGKVNLPASEHSRRKISKGTDALDT